MTICHTLRCKTCGDEFFATYGDDESFPEKCPTHDKKSRGRKRSQKKLANTPSFDSFGNPFTDRQGSAKDWDGGMSPY